MTEQSKVYVSKDVKEELDRKIKVFWSKDCNRGRSHEEMVALFAWQLSEGFLASSAIGKLDVELLTLALLKGYEYKETKEDKIRQYYKGLEISKSKAKTPDQELRLAWQKQTVRDILQILEVEVTDINC